LSGSAFSVCAGLIDFVAQSYASASLYPEMKKDSDPLQVRYQSGMNDNANRESRSKRVGAWLKTRF